MVQRILVTGASGCIGHYISEILIQETNHDLFLMVRDPAKLKVDVDARPGVTVVHEDMMQVEHLGEFLKTMTTAVLTAAAWGGQQETFDVNLLKTTTLMKLLDPQVCQQVIYFSTASILGQDNQPLKEAYEMGTDYIRTKYLCHQQLHKLAIAPKITTLFPTLVFGGDDRKPKSHLTAGLPEVAKWINLIRFLKADGSFHFIHGRDIAQVVRHLIEHPPAADQSRELVLGNSPLTANQAVEEVCAYLNQPIYFRIPLSFWLADVLINVFKIQMEAWDRFCLRYRHFTYQNPVNPSTFGTVPYCSTVADLLKLSGVQPQIKG